MKMRSYIGIFGVTRTAEVKAILKSIPPQLMDGFNLPMIKIGLPLSLLMMQGYLDEDEYNVFPELSSIKRLPVGHEQGLFAIDYTTHMNDDIYGQLANIAFKMEENFDAIRLRRGIPKSHAIERFKRDFKNIKIIVPAGPELTEFSSKRIGNIAKMMAGEYGGLADKFVIDCPRPGSGPISSRYGELSARLAAFENAGIPANQLSVSIDAADISGPVKLMLKDRPTVSVDIDYGLRYDTQYGGGFLNAVAAVSALKKAATAYLENCAVLPGR